MPAKIIKKKAPKKVPVPTAAAPSASTPAQPPQPAPPPAPTPLVSQIMEMGFPRRHIEYAMQTTQSSNLERLVSWLLDHANLEVPELNVPPPSAPTPKPSATPPTVNKVPAREGGGVAGSESSSDSSDYSEGEGEDEEDGDGECGVCEWMYLTARVVYVECNLICSGQFC